MSTGVGNHQYVGVEGMRKVYETPKAYCPYCGCDDCEADYVDVGVGMVQCGPYYCPACHASEASSLDSREMTEREKETGWYAPGTPVSETANQDLDGNLVDHQTAKGLYCMGLLKKND